MAGKRFSTATLLFLLAVSVGMGCTTRLLRKEAPAPREEKRGSPPAEKEVTAAKAPQVKVKLYFADTQAQYLVAETRMVSTQNAEREALEQLLKGPQKENLVAPLPAGTRILGVETKGNVAYANFGEELVKKHSGGSAAETMTIYSVVNTLAQFSGVGKVKILVEGRTVETISGHYDLTQAFEPRWDLVRK